MQENTNPQWDSGKSAYDSILLVGFGGPTPGCCRRHDPCLGEAYCFVEGIVGDAPSNAARVKEVASHYIKLGGFSPFNELTFKQADALGTALRKRGVDSPIYVGCAIGHHIFMKQLQGWLKRGIVTFLLLSCPPIGLKLVGNVIRTMLLLPSKR